MYLNVGHAEGRGRTNGQQWMVPNTNLIYNHLLQNGWTRDTARLDIYESDFHSFERGVQWLPEALQWLYPRNNK